MGSNTLVELVNQIWNVASTAVSTIKDATTTALNAVKSGLSFIADTVLGPILDGIIFGTKSILSAISIVVASLLGLDTNLLDVISTTNGLLFNYNGNQKELILKRDNLNIEIGEIDNLINLGNPFVPSNLQVFETLAIGEAVRAATVWTIINTVLAGMLFAIPSYGGLPFAILAIISMALLGVKAEVEIINQVTEDERSEYNAFMIRYHLNLGFSLWEARKKDGNEFITTLKKLFLGNSIASLLLTGNNYIGSDLEITEILAEQFTGLIVIPVLAAFSGFFLEIGANKGFAPNPLNDFQYEIPVFTLLSGLHIAIPTMLLFLYGFAGTW